ncbi:transmembrane protein 70 homolog, mitochondrial [Calliopsis andreniformis]|uniref:transmembrane protein 70 homolog, mitochondrial n=1 Tax=Calliopsis andreniformis TaxID=337506 RepID=UPI003FCD2529
MASVLRACILIQRKRCLQEFASVERSLTYFTKSSGNIKKFIPAVQVKYFSSQEDTEPDKIAVYKGTLAKRFRNLKAFSLLTSCTALLVQPFLYLKAIENDNIVVVTIAFGTVAIFAIGTPLMIHIIAKKYVTDLYYYPKENKYVAEIYTLFLRKKQIEFTAADVEVPDVTGMFTSCIIKGTSIFLHEHDFKDVTHYYNIMGFYKPIDFKLGNVEEVKLDKEEDEEPKQIKMHNKG